jgi:hydrogenase maturation protein HypF
VVPVAGSRDGTAIIRRRLIIGGIVQGVGFRPFVYRLARTLELSGWVRNTPAGVELEVEGAPETVADFERAVSTDAPLLAVISSLEGVTIPTGSDSGFTILPSAAGEASIQVAPDSALCSDCLRELLDPDDRRYRYPFITCTNCGPRYSIITGIPYDRPKTTMAGFPLCPDCLREYHDPDDRRFHAQPIACPACGPQVRLVIPPPSLPPLGGGACLPPPEGEGRGGGSLQLLAEGDSAILQAIELLKNGKILAIKGIGGYHLAVNACDDAAVQRLRKRKQRDEKPFAVMAPDLATARTLTRLSDEEERLLTGPESPIVIVRKAPDCPVSELVAPNNGWLGLMLPYTPIHHLLFRTSSTFDVQGSRLEPRTTNHEPRTALVMTSANISDEPIAYTNDDALQRLGGIADYFLVHDRPIHIRSDDSVMRVFQGKPLFYRRARGYAPRSVRLPFESAPILGAGAELKSAICLAKGRQAFLSQHIGDLQNSPTNDAFRATIDHLSGILEIAPTAIACDLHPDYLSSIYAAESGLPVIAVQHHHAHMAACMAENGIDGPTLGIIFDGTGYGSDGTIWGGEFLVGGYDNFRRAAFFRPTQMPGGDAAVREPWRMAVSFLYQTLGSAAFDIDHPLINRLTEQEKSLLAAMLEKSINTPLTSGCGRLFDAVAALLGVRQTVSYDGQAAIELEALAETSGDEQNYPFQLTPILLKDPLIGSKGAQGPAARSGLELDFTPLFPRILADLAAGIPVAAIARRFHRSVAQATIEAGTRIATENRLEQVVLSGGAFQNRLLSKMIYTGLTKRGLQVFTHRLVPPNDGCIALGQVAVAARRMNLKNKFYVGDPHEISG